jgi:hypothetical protein
MGVNRGPPPPRPPQLKLQSLPSDILCGESEGNEVGKQIAGNLVEKKRKQGDRE